MQLPTILDKKKYSIAANQGHMYTRVKRLAKQYAASCIVLPLCAAVLLLSQCMNANDAQENAEAQPAAASFAAYAGDQACMQCHQSISETHLTTAHHLTAALPSESTVQGSFKEGQNAYNYTQDIQLRMEKRDSGLFQVAYVRGKEKKAMRFDMVIGSGVMGQSYLNWRGARLYQLPISYFSAADQWSNSPGFPSQRVLIDRPVSSRCLECHTTYAEAIPAGSMEPMEFKQPNILYGVGCEKCHGPAADHVTYHTAHRQDTMPKYIINPERLSAQRQLDLCALCHGGNIQKARPSFEYIVGKPLQDYFAIDSMHDAAAASGSIDVHGNQVGLLKSSKCFKAGGITTCSTCHDTHQNQRGQKELFSAKCIHCHSVTAASFGTPTHRAVAGIEKNCIDCHMPAQKSQSIAMYLQGEETPRASSVRSHYIAVYNTKQNKY